MGALAVFLSTVSGATGTHECEVYSGRVATYSSQVVLTLGGTQMTAATLMKYTLAIFLLGMMLGGYVAKKWLAWTTPSPAGCRTVRTQSMVRYSRELQNPRFQPLPEYTQGVWVD